MRRRGRLYNANEIWDKIAKVARREIESFLYFGISNEVNEVLYEHCMEYLRNSNNVADVLSLVEFCAQEMGELARSGNASAFLRGATEDPAEGVVELNERFLRAGVGYQFENGEIIRVDSQYVHAEVIKEALRLLCEPGFEEANTEFMTAHRHLLEGTLRDCNTAALRSMENVLKVICDARGWERREGDNIERLLAIVRRERLFPDYLGGCFDNLIGAMRALDECPAILLAQGPRPKTHASCCLAVAHAAEAETGYLRARSPKSYNNSLRFSRCWAELQTHPSCGGRFLRQRVVGLGLKVTQDLGCRVAGRMRGRKAGISGRLYQNLFDLAHGETVRQTDANVVLELLGLPQSYENA
jgi:hypothetical protein